MTIVASSHGHRATIQPRRPSWKDMLKYYPGQKYPREVFYPMVSEEWNRLAIANPNDYENTCATRMSYGLNRSGMRLPVAPNGGSIKGDHDKDANGKKTVYNYWMRVKQLLGYLKEHFGSPDLEFTYKESVPRTADEVTQALIQKRVDEVQGFLNKLKVKHGIVAFEVKGWGNATGHFTLWDGTNLGYVDDKDNNNPSSILYYFWMIELRVINAWTYRISFWELK